MKLSIPPFARILLTSVVENYKSHFSPVFIGIVEAEINGQLDGALLTDLEAVLNKHGINIRASH
jgi:hypothetical protein